VGDSFRDNATGPNLAANGVAHRVGSYG